MSSLRSNIRRIGTLSLQKNLNADNTENQYTDLHITHLLAAITIAVDNMQVRVSLPPNPPPNSSIYIFTYTQLNSYVNQSIATAYRVF